MSQEIPEIYIIEKIKYTPGYENDIESTNIIGFTFDKKKAEQYTYEMGSRNGRPNTRYQKIEHLQYCKAFLVPDIYKQIDWPLLKKQKELLFDICSSSALKFAIKKRSTRYGRAISGILLLLDAIQDEAAKLFGEKIVFGDDNAKTKEKE